MSRDVTALMPEMIDPVEGHPDTCNCTRRSDGEIVWKDECLEDEFVKWQEQEIEERSRGEGQNDWFKE